MPSVLTPGQTADVLVLERTTSIASIIGCILIFATFLGSHCFRRPINRLIFYASWGNLLMNVATLMSVTPTSGNDPKDKPLCRFQGFMIQMFLPADALWNLSIAINVYLTVFRQWNADQLKRLEPIYIVFNYGSTFLIALTYIFINDGGPDGRGRMYGPATLWCWVDEKWDGFRIYLCYAPAWACILAIFVIYILAGLDIYRKKRALQPDQTPRPEALQEALTKVAEPPEVRVTTEISYSSYHTPLASPFRPLSITVTSKHLFNPFSLHPDHRRGYDPYSITIERGTDNDSLVRRAADFEAEANAAAWSYTKTAILYFFSLLITWVPSSMNRVYSLVYPGEISFAFSIMAGLVLPLMGFWNSVIYFVTSYDAVIASWNDIKARRTAAAMDVSKANGNTADDATWVEIMSVRDRTSEDPGTSTRAAVTRTGSKMSLRKDDGVS